MQKAMQALSIVWIRYSTWSDARVGHQLKADLPTKVVRNFPELENEIKFLIYDIVHVCITCSTMTCSVITLTYMCLVRETNYTVMFLRLTLPLDRARRSA